MPRALDLGMGLTSTSVVGSGRLQLPVQTIWHIDADDLSTLWTEVSGTPSTHINGNDGDSIGQTGKAGNKYWRASSASLPNRRPKYKTGIAPNGKPIIRFDSTDDKLEVGLIQGSGFSTDNYTFSIVFALRSDVNAQGIFSCGKNGGNDWGVADGFFLADNTTSVSGAVNFFQGSGAELTTADLSNAFHCVTVDVGGGTRAIRVDGTEINSISQADETIDDAELTFVVGCRLSGGYAVFGELDLAEFALYDSQQSLANITATENYLMGKWGL